MLDVVSNEIPITYMMPGEMRNFTMYPDVRWQKMVGNTTRSPIRYYLQDWAFCDRCHESCCEFDSTLILYLYYIYVTYNLRAASYQQVPNKFVW